MRWESLSTAAPEDGSALPGLAIPGLVRSVTTPEFAGVRFHEVRAKSALNQVPASSSMPFGWTINPYRGCTHACTYCFARKTHTWLDLDAGNDFDREIVVKTNVAQVVAAEVRRPGWQREHVALGTNTDPYQRAEGRYRLMPGIIEALASSGTPFSILTKGTLLRRDLPRLTDAARDVPVGLGVSLAIWDEDLHASLEPGTPTPQARLDLLRRARDAGLPCGVFMAPVLPWLTDSEDHLDAAFAALAHAGATGVTVLPLHLRPGAREWFFAWLRRARSDLVAGYERLYARGAYVPTTYRTWLQGRVRPLLARHGLDGRSGGQQRAVPGGVPGDEEGSFPAGSLPTAGTGAPERAPGTSSEQLRLL